MSELKYEKDQVLNVEDSCERCMMSLVKPIFRCPSGHEFCSPCYTEVMTEKDVPNFNVELSDVQLSEKEKDHFLHDEDSCERCMMSLVKPFCSPRYTEAMLEKEMPNANVDLSDVELSEGEYEDAIAEDVERTDNFEMYEMSQSNFTHQAHRPGSMRPHTFGGGEKKRNCLVFESGSKMSQKGDSNDELKITKLRPPEHKKSFIDMISQKSGMNISYTTDKEDLEDRNTEDSSDEIEESEILEEVFKKISICSLDSVRSGASLKYKPIVCPLDSCMKFVSVSGWITHFLFDHPKIPLQYMTCNETASFFVESCTIDNQNLILHERIFVIDADSKEDSGFFSLNITKQCSAGMDVLLMYVSEIKTNRFQYLYKIRANIVDKECGKVVSFFGPVSTHRDPLSVFQNGDGLVIPITVSESFKEFGNGFDVEITFFVEQECVSVEDMGDQKRSN